MNTTLSEIEKSTKAFSEAHNDLSDFVTNINKQIEAIKTANMKVLRSKVAKTAERHSELKALIEGAPALFDKPRTVTVHGVKVGLQKGKGGIEIVDEDKTVELIQKVYGDLADDYLIVERFPSRMALEQLPVHDLKKVGCNVVNATDTVVIKPVAGDVGKIVAALIKDATEDES